ncbi:MAG TPA: hypothetical protein VE954_27695 [Oligoflexus sp.]|uniref:hypothetical protein n=1 Tax=Oligoflexus sp. TaxID=1971216 RepID=UPI002D61E0F3|nr:hypothetical protein [Oligoflexus sp.]HYX36909.1 hypothetical protein [Oligoflexus sp.]
MQKFWMAAGALLLIASETSAAEKCRDWAWQKGSRKTAQFGLNADLCLGAHNPQAVVNEVKARGEAEGYLLDKRIPLLRTEAGTRSQQGHNLELNAGVFIVGQKVWSPSLNVATPYYEKSFNLPALDMEFPYRVQLGPIGVKVAAGVRGTAGVDLNASAELAQLQARMIPHLDTNGYAYADIDLWLAHVGAESSLLFARGDINLGASTQVVIKDNTAMLTGSVLGLYALRTLDGRLNVYADTKSARRRGVHSWERQLLGFDGFAMQGTMFEAAIPEVAIY